MSGAAVVTGLGVIAPNGEGVEEYWTACLKGRSGIGTVARFDVGRYPVTLAGEVSGFRAEDHLSQKLIRQSDRMTQLALVAADWALADLGVDADRFGEFGAGVVTASSAGGFEFGQRELENLWRRGPQYVSTYQSFAWFYAVNTGQISIRHGLRGPGGVVVTEQSGGLDALAQARRQIRRGTALMLCGGVDGAVCPWGWAAQLTAERMSRCADPDRAYLPFDREASGHVAGEGGALLVLEDGAAALSRGARQIYGEIAGYAATMDPRPGSGREPSLRRAVESAVRDAGVEPADVDVVFADGAGVPHLDAAEAAVIEGVFGPGGVPVTVPKTMTGRLNAGAASLDTATALLSLRDGVIPPTVNVRPAPEFHLDLVVDAPRPAPVRTALVIARGHGGFNSALVIRTF
ncbi:ketosynthase chain-length factor [Streptomyces sp. NPDC087425]|uniref:ketosynthase chain-length factor n=1 Tax=Streptomyces sp. NPDC087425 TaxID=3365787 RepID=UPI00382ECD54